MTSDELIQQLETRGLITPAIATRLKRDSVVSGQSPEETLSRERIIPDEQVAEVKSELLKVPYKAVDPATIDEKLLAMVPEETARTYQVIPLSLQENLLRGKTV